MANFLLTLLLIRVGSIAPVRSRVATLSDLMAFQDMMHVQ
jgi:hypothetical protein